MFRLLGRLWWLLQALLPQFWLGGAAKALANAPWPRLKDRLIRFWIRWYRIDMSEAVWLDPESYPTFMDFFTRHLKDQARPLPEDRTLLLSPADAQLMQYGTLNNDWLLQAKRRSYTLTELLGDADLARQFDGCDYACLYLRPGDYHRVHMPLPGKLQSTRRLPGRLFSVGPLSVLGVPRLYAGNRRCSCLFETEAGPMVLVLVGALMVGRVRLAWERSDSRNSRHWGGALKLDRGAEVGRFELGSAVVLVAPPGYRLLDSLERGNVLKVGTPLAKATAS